MISGGIFGLDDAAGAAVLAGLIGLGTAGLTTGINAALAPDAPEPTKPNLPGAAAPTPVGTSAGPTQSPFMGRQQMNNDQRQSTALSMLARR